VRGRKHLQLLGQACREGFRGVMIYALNRSEGGCFKPADDIDAAYGDTLRQVAAQGVEIIALRIKHTPRGMRVAGEVPVRL
jgi:sugar fermentation stimulation protein A